MPRTARWHGSSTIARSRRSTRPSCGAWCTRAAASTRPSGAIRTTGRRCRTAPGTRDRRPRASPFRGSSTASRTCTWRLPRAARTRSACTSAASATRSSATRSTAASGGSCRPTSGWCCVSSVRSCTRVAWRSCIPETRNGGSSSPPRSPTTCRACWTSSRRGPRRERHVAGPAGAGPPDYRSRALPSEAGRGLVPSHTFR